MVGRSIASVEDLGGIFMYLGSFRSAIDLPTVLYNRYTYVHIIITQ